MIAHAADFLLEKQSDSAAARLPPEPARAWRGAEEAVKDIAPNTRSTMEHALQQLRYPRADNFRLQGEFLARNRVDIWLLIVSLIESHISARSLQMHPRSPS